MYRWEGTVTMRRLTGISPRSVTQIPLSPFSRFCFFSTRLAWLWLLLRLVISYQWLTLGGAKLTGVSIAADSFGKPLPGGSWIIGARHGFALMEFIQGALTKVDKPVPDVQFWYAAFLRGVVLPHVGIMAYVIAFGEVLVGLGLLTGSLTGIAAFFALFLNLNYMLAGSVSINPLLAVGELFLLLAWRVSGYYGVDRYLLPLLGTPWTGPLAPSRTVKIAQTE